MAESGMLPSGEERPAGSRRTPVGRRAVELSEAGMSDGGALAEREGLEQLASRNATSSAAEARYSWNGIMAASRSGKRALQCLDSVLRFLETHSRELAIPLDRGYQLLLLEHREQLRIRDRRLVRGAGLRSRFPDHLVVGAAASPDHPKYDREHRDGEIP